MTDANSNTAGTFDVQSSDESHGFLARGLMKMLSARLDGAGEISVVDQASILAALDGSETDTLAPERARSLAGQFRAGRFVIPSASPGSS